MILHIDGLDQDVVYCPTCFAFVFEADALDHGEWHAGIRRQFQAAFDAIHAIDAKGGY